MSCADCHCNGTGTLIVCGLCREGVKHSNCDDPWYTFKVPCPCKCHTEKLPMPFPQEVIDIARKIGQFYLGKNKGNYGAATTEIEDTKIDAVNVYPDHVEICTARPGRLIGPRGRNIEALEKFLKTNVRIKEVERIEDYINPFDGEY